MIDRMRSSGWSARSATRATRRVEFGLTANPRLSAEMLASGVICGLGLIGFVGPLGVLTFVLFVGMLIIMRPIFTLHELIRFSPLLVLPLFAVMSAIWSDAPTLTMRASLELLVTFVGAIVACRNMRAERLLLIMFAIALANAIILVPGIIRGFGSVIPLGGYGNKNSVGFTGYLLGVLSLAIICDRSQRWFLRFLCGVTLLLGLSIAKLSQSGGALGSFALILLVFPPLAVLGLFRLPMRITLVVIAILLLAVGLVFRDDIVNQIASFRSSVLNKDATLTGRTYLWDFADRLAASRPWLGYGYASFWRHGNVDAEGLWRWGGIGNRSGFNFHNAYLEMRVDLGWLGWSILIFMCAAITLAALARQLKDPQVALAALIAMAFVSYSRSFVEDGLVSAFSLVNVLWLATCIYAVSPRVGSARAVSLFIIGRSRAAAPRVIGNPDLPRRTKAG